jgi:hypothetical protein
MAVGVAVLRNWRLYPWSAGVSNHICGHMIHELKRLVKIEQQSKQRMDEG